MHLVQIVTSHENFFFQAEDGIRDWSVTGVQTCALPICHAINLSGASLSDPSIVRFIADLLQETQAPPHQLHLEVTEQIALQAESGQSILKGLSELGCCIGLDDFGTGYSSFLYLQKFRPDFIKIDGSFMRHILTDPCSQAIVRAM